MTATLIQAAEKSGTEEADCVTGEISGEDGAFVHRNNTTEMNPGTFRDDKFSTMRETY